MTSPTITCSPEHKYTVDGMPFDGVTTVISSVIRKEGLERWIGQVGNAEAERIRSEAAAHGTLVHALAALVVSGLPSIPMMADEEPTDAQMDAFTTWFETYVEEVHAVELKVAHGGYRYAGTLDLLVRMKGDKRPTIVDLKTGKAVYREFALQLAAYREAIVKNTSSMDALGYSRRDCRRGVLHIPRDVDGPAHFHEYRKHGADFQAFLAALTIYRWQRS